MEIPAFLINPREPCLALVFVPVSQVACIPLVRRSKDGRTWWDLLGGKIEPGENVAAGLEREVREESGMIVETQRYIGHLPHPALAGLKRHFFSATHVTGYPLNVEPAEHEELCLMRPADALVALGDRIPESAKRLIHAGSHQSARFRPRLWRPDLFCSG